MLQSAFVLVSVSLAEVAALWYKSSACVAAPCAHSVLYVMLACYFQVRMNIHPFNGPLSGTTRVSQYQKGKTSLNFTEARDSEWQWRQLGHMQVCTSLQTDNHASTPPLSFLQAGCPSCRPANSVKALKAWVKFSLPTLPSISVFSSPFFLLFCFWFRAAD